MICHKTYFLKKNKKQKIPHICLQKYNKIKYKTYFSKKEIPSYMFAKIKLNIRFISQKMKMFAKIQ